MFSYICLVLYVGLNLSYAYKCGECTCVSWMNTLSCSGKNITTLPVLADPSWISHIDVIFTSISSIKTLEEWTHRFTADIRDNMLLPCREVLDLQREKIEALIITDCDDAYPHPLTPPNSIQSPYSPTDWMNLLVLLPFLGIIGLGVYNKRLFGVLSKNRLKSYEETCDQLTNVSDTCETRV